MRVTDILVAAGVGKLFRFLVAQECTMHTNRVRSVHRLEKHVAAAKQLLGTGVIHHGTRVHLRRHLEADTRRQVRLDVTGNHLHRGTLGRKHQVNANSTSLCSKAAHVLLDFLSGDHHEVGHLVDNHYDKRHAVATVGIGHVFGEQAGIELLVEAVEVTHLRLRKHLGTAVHLVAEPLERLDSNFGLRDDRRQEVRDVLVHLEFHRLRVHENHAEFVRSLAQEHARHKSVNTDGLTGTRLARNHQVRSLRQVHGERLARNILAERHDNLVGRRLERLALEDVAPEDGLHLAVRNLDTHGTLSGNRREDADRDCLKRHREVILQGAELRYLHARARFHLEARNYGAGLAADHLPLHLEVLELFLEHAANRVEFVLGIVRRLRVVLVENLVHRRDAVRVVMHSRVWLRNPVRRTARKRRTGGRCADLVRSLVGPVLLAFRIASHCRIADRGRVLFRLVARHDFGHEGLVIGGRFFGLYASRIVIALATGESRNRRLFRRTRFRLTGNNRRVVGGLGWLILGLGSTHGTLHHDLVLVGAFPVQHLAGTADFGNLVPDFLDLERAHVAVVVAQLLFQTQNFGILARKVGFDRNFDIPFGHPRRFPSHRRGRHRGRNRRLIRFRTVPAGKNRGFHPILAGAERLELALVLEPEPVGLLVNRVVVKERDALAFRKADILAHEAASGFIIRCILVLFRTIVLFLEQTYKPAESLGDKGEMTRTEPERNHENHHQHTEEHKERGQVGCRPENGNRDILAEELADYSAVHHHHFAAQLGHAVVLERKEAREVDCQEAHADSKAQATSANRAKRKAEAPKDQRKGERHHGQLTEYKAERFGNQPAEIGTEPVALGTAIDGTHTT